MRVVITRPRRDAATLVQVLRSGGAEVFCTPAIDIVAFTSETKPTLINKQKFTALIFSSRNGVRFFNRWLAKHADATFRRSMRNRDVELATVGARSASLLRRSFKQPAIFPTAADKGSAGLVSLLRQRWKGRRQHILLPTARGEGVDLARALRRLGHKVTLLPCYETRARTPEAIDLRPWRGSQVDFVLFYSPSAARAYTRAMQRNRLVMGRTKVVSIGSTTSKTLKKLGLKVVSQIAESTPREVVESLQSLCYNKTALTGRRAKRT